METVINKRKIIGVTGRLGSGKSFLCRVLCSVLNGNDHQCSHVDVDEIRRDIFNDPKFEKSVSIPLVELFGRSILCDDSRIDRGALSKIIFSNGKALRSFENIIDPVIISELQNRLQSTSDLVFLESALFLEKGLLPMTNFNLIVVSSSESLRWSRLKNTAGDLSKEELDARLSLQLKDGEYEKHYRKVSKPGAFFFVIDNQEKDFVPTVSMLASNISEWFG